jgi:hypothetical protein
METPYVGASGEPQSAERQPPELASGGEESRLRTVAQKHKGGRPRVKISPSQVKDLRDQGMSWRKVALALDTSTATAERLYQSISGASQNSVGPSQNSCRTRTEGIPRPGPTEPSGAPEPQEPATEVDQLQPDQGPEIVEPPQSEDKVEPVDEVPAGIRPISVRRRLKSMTPRDEGKAMKPTGGKWRPYDGGKLPPCPVCGLRRHRLMAGSVICDACFPVSPF